MKTLYNKLKSLPRNKRDAVGLSLMIVSLFVVMVIIELARQISIPAAGIILFVCSTLFVIGIDLFNE